MNAPLDPSPISILTMNTGDAVANLSTISGVPDGTLCYVPASRTYFQLNIYSVASPNGSTVIAALGGGNWLAFSSAGVDSGGNIASATLTWPATTVNPTITEAAQTSDAACNNLHLTPQAPFASATGTNRNPGSLEVDLAIPTNSGTGEAGLVVSRNGTPIFFFGAANGTGGIPQFSFGYGTGTNGGAYMQVVSGQMFINSQSGQPVVLGVGASGVFQASATGISGGASGVPFRLQSSAVTFAATGTTTLSAGQQQTPQIVLSTVSLTGAATLDFGNVNGNYWVDVSGITLAGQTLTFKNGTATIVVSPLMSANKTLIAVSCTSNHIAAG